VSNQHLFWLAHGFLDVHKRIEIVALNTDHNQEWIEVVVSTSVPLAEGLATELVKFVEAAQSGVQVRKNEVVFWVRGEQLQRTLKEAKQCLEQLQSAGWKVDPKAVRAGELAPEEEWRDAWKKHFHVTRLTRQIVVVPSWEQYAAKEEDITITLDPGQAFGTGAHASTQLVLEELQKLADTSQQAPTKVFDLGTGSGILAIAAAKLWPSCQVRATDIDPLSITATRENAAINQVAGQINVDQANLGDINMAFPIVLANIQAHILRDLRDALLPRLASGGHLIMSGILTTQISPLVEFYLQKGSLELVRIRESETDSEWSSAHLQRARA
jgi:ribosomal protein L11 methyltransferase